MASLDTPLVATDDDSTPYGDKPADVLDFEGFRIKFGRPKFTKERCDHRTLVYNTSERRIWCEDCQNTIDNFDAFMRLRDVWFALVDDLHCRQKEVAEAEAVSLTSRVAKHVDAVFRKRKMIPVCPHCRHGLLPQDMLKLGNRFISKEIEVARRQKDHPND